MYDRPAFALASFGAQVCGCGCSSVVEHDLAKVGVASSNLVARSNYFNGLAQKTGAGWR